MKTRTNDFKEQIAKLGREIDFKFFLHTNDKIITQDGKFLITQDNRSMIVEQFDDEEVDEIITSQDIDNVTIINSGRLLSTLMKELDFEIKQDLRVGDVIGCQFGLKVGDNYEYIDYGNYMIYSKEFNEDTKTYSYVAFDRMLLSMVTVENTSVFDNMTILEAIQYICDLVGLDDSEITDDLISIYPNLSKIINENTFADMEITYRDVLDMICQALGLSMIIENKKLILKSLNDQIVDTIDSKYLKNTNVSFGEKYGPINSVVLSRSEDTDNIYRRDEESIDENGLCEFKIRDNLIMLGDDREDYIDEIFNQLNGVEYYINDFSSTGITYLDWLDFYNVEIDDKIYKCLMLNDEITITQGLTESVYTEEPDENETNYKTSSKTDKEVSFIVDKQRGQINAKVSKGNVINEINLDESGASIKADKIKLEGYTTINDGFSIDTSGNMTCNNAKINGGKIDITGGTESDPNLKVISNDRRNETFIIPAYIQTTASTSTQSSMSSNEAISSLNIQTDLYYTSLNAYSSNSTVSNPDSHLVISKQGQYQSMRNELIMTDYYSALYLYRNNNKITAIVNDYGVPTMTIDDGTNSTFISSQQIITPTVTQTSKEEDKKDFEKLNNGLDIIKNIEIYKYHLKSQNDEDKKHIGFVIGDNYKYSQEITANENNGVNIYSFVSVCCKAIQEQQEQIDSLKEEIKKLKESDK